MQPKEKARINHGRRGRQKPPQGYNASSWDELICSSAAYGHDDDIVSYFNRMKEANQKRFLLKALSEDCAPLSPQSRPSHHQKPLTPNNHG